VPKGNNKRITIGSTVAEPMPGHPKVKGLSPAFTAGPGGTKCQISFTRVWEWNRLKGKDQYSWPPH